jgi:glyoxalase family protein
MDTRILGIHHVTAISGDAQRTLEFYRDILGLRLIKRTVNYEDTRTYHLYFGDDRGNPSTIISFLPYPEGSPDTPEVGEAAAVAFSVPKGSLDFWLYRLRGIGLNVSDPIPRFGEDVISLKDPDLLTLEIVADAPEGVGYGWPGGPVAPALSIRGIHSVTLYRSDISSTQTYLEQTMGIQAVHSEGIRKRFKAGIKFLGNWLDIVVDPEITPTQPGPGSLFNIAFRVASDTIQDMWRHDLQAEGMDVTDVMDRTYFKSVYFQEPGGTVLEIATDEPGFEVDETRDALGESLTLPMWLEGHRERIEERLSYLV